MFCLEGGNWSESYIWKMCFQHSVEQTGGQGSSEEIGGKRE
jgi:hypothetical protein